MTDVIRPTGTTWLISWQGRDPWETFRITDQDLDEAAFGELDGRAGDDLFATGCL